MLKIDVFKRIILFNQVIPFTRWHGDGLTSFSIVMINFLTDAAVLGYGIVNNSQWFLTSLNIELRLSIEICT